jgi:hydroxyacylglutathione hydrolase
MPLVHTRLNLGPLDNNTYVVACSDTREAAVIDVGFEPQAAIDELRRAGLTLTMLLNTHAHYDHAAGMREVQQALGGTYWLHPADRPLLARLADQGAAFGFPVAWPPEDIHDLADGQRLSIGRH